MTGNNEHGCVNIWSKEAGLTRLGAHSFLTQKYKSPESDIPSDFKLQHTEFTKSVDEKGVVIHCRKARLFNATNLKDKDSQAEAQVAPVEEIEEEDFFGMFVDTTEALIQEKLETKSDVTDYEIDEELPMYEENFEDFTKAWHSQDEGKVKAKV